MKMEIGFDAPVAGVVKEVRARKGQQVAAGDVLLVIEPAGEAQPAARCGERLAFPKEPDPLAPLFRALGDGELGEPDLCRGGCRGARAAARGDGRRAATRCAACSSATTPTPSAPSSSRTSSRRRSRRASPRASAGSSRRSATRSWCSPTSSSCSSARPAARWAASSASRTARGCACSCGASARGRRHRAGVPRAGAARPRATTASPASSTRTRSSARCCACSPRSAPRELRHRLLLALLRCVHALAWSGIHLGDDRALAGRAGAARRACAAWSRTRSPTPPLEASYVIFERPAHRARGRAHQQAPRGLARRRRGASPTRAARGGARAT